MTGVKEARVFSEEIEQPRDSSTVQRQSSRSFQVIETITEASLQTSRNLPPPWITRKKRLDDSSA